MQFTDGDRSILFMGAESTLYYPGHDAYVNAFRAYFQLKNGIHAGDPSSQVKLFELNFGDGETTTVQSLEQLFVPADQWYDLSGRRINVRPATPGIYIYNGRKIIIK